MGFFEKLKSGLRRTKNALFGTVEQILRAFVRIDENLFEELEEALIMCVTHWWQEHDSSSAHYAWR